MKREIDAQQLLADAIEKHGGQRALARKFGVSQAYIYQLVKGIRPISASILDKLGVRRILIDKRTLTH